MVFENLLINLINNLAGINPYLVAFFGPLIGGEPVFVLLAFMVGSLKAMPLMILFISGTLADILDDLFWFFVVRSKRFRKYDFVMRLIKKSQSANIKLKSFEEHELPFFIIGSKFLVGTRVFAIISISLNDIKAGWFITCSVFSAFLWSIVIVTMGWTAGKGFVLVKEIFHSTRIAISILFLIIVITLIIRRHLHHKASRIIKIKHKPKF